MERYLWTFGGNVTQNSSQGLLVTCWSQLSNSVKILEISDLYVCSCRQKSQVPTYERMTGSRVLFNFRRHLIQMHKSTSQLSNFWFPLYFLYLSCSQLWRDIWTFSGNAAQNSVKVSWLMLISGKFSNKHGNLLSIFIISSQSVLDQKLSEME